ncbi:hypothetical protein B0T17DRAFT_258326 [Bombardia bombarda]|uniref:Uncharacterized protein n=1 Tax=Bombardia bombarda TaxID=252184 RepID=A0AA39X0F4_9PEZI|nr:hypothetical protein B0T17DRAFT_258326 [Bombardia bombarda]
MASEPDDELVQVMMNPEDASLAGRPVAGGSTPKGKLAVIPDLDYVNQRLRGLTRSPEVEEERDPVKYRNETLAFRAELIALGGVPSREFRPFDPKDLHPYMDEYLGEWPENDYWQRELQAWQAFVTWRQKAFKHQIAGGYISASSYLCDPLKNDDKICVLYDFIYFLGHNRNRAVFDSVKREMEVAITITKQQISDLVKERSPLACDPSHWHFRDPVENYEHLIAIQATKDSQGNWIVDPVLYGPPIPKSPTPDKEEPPPRTYEDVLQGSREGQDPEERLASVSGPLGVRTQTIGYRNRLISLGGIPSREYRPSAPEHLLPDSPPSMGELIENLYWNRELRRWQDFVYDRAGLFGKQVAKGVVSSSHHLPDPLKSEDLLCVLYDFIDHLRNRDARLYADERYDNAIETAQRQIDELVRERGPLVCPPLHFHTRPPQQIQAEHNGEQPTSTTPKRASETSRPMTDEVNATTKEPQPAAHTHTLSKRKGRVQSEDPILPAPKRAKRNLQPLPSSEVADKPSKESTPHPTRENRGPGKRKLDTESEESVLPASKRTRMTLQPTSIRGKTTSQQSEPQPEAQPDVQPDIQPDVQPDAQPDAQPDVQPHGWSHRLRKRKADTQGDETVVPVSNPRKTILQPKSIRAKVIAKNTIPPPAAQNTSRGKRKADTQDDESVLPSSMGVRKTLQPKSVKARQTKAQQTKAQPTKAQQTKAQQTKARQTKAQQTKAQQTKARQTKTRQTKTQQTKKQPEVAGEDHRRGNRKTVEVPTEGLRKSVRIAALARVSYLR